MQIERRFLSVSLRAETSDKGNFISGYAATFDNYSSDLGGFVERISPGAFSRALKERQDVRALHNHNADLILARVSAGTLQLNEDKKGLRFRAKLAETSYSEDLLANIEAGNISECSFGFIARDEAWSKEADPDDEDAGLRQVRTLKDCDLVDVSTCVFPAYGGTAVGASSRSLWPQGMPAEVRSHLNQRAADDEGECSCDCAMCRGGACDECDNTDCDSPDCAGCPMQEDTRGNRGGDPAKQLLQLAEGFFQSDVPDDAKAGVWTKLEQLAIAAGLDGDDERSARERAVDLAIASAEW